MSFLFNRNSISEAIEKHPEKVRRLLIRQGHEKIADDLIEKARKNGIQYRVLPSDAFSKKCGSAKSHLCLERDEFQYAEQEEFLTQLDTMKAPFLAAFDGVQDPQNLGNIVRSSACLGLNGLILPKDRACMITDTVVNVSRGGTELVQIVRVTNLVRYIDSLKKRGIFCYGLDEKAKTVLWDIDLKGPICLVMGGEEGLRRLTRETCDDLVRIPTNPAFPSLNVATAYALASYEVTRQRY
ncbi:MAG: TrmH family RNA methyltransferase [Syntrophorhabdaceae bacterium]